MTLPDGIGVVASNVFVGAYERGEAVGFGVGNDHEVERIAGPVFEERGFGKVRKGMVADGDTDLGPELLCEILRRANDSADLVEEIEFYQYDWGDQQV